MHILKKGSAWLVLLCLTLLTACQGTAPSEVPAPAPAESAAPSEDDAGPAVPDPALPEENASAAHDEEDAPSGDPAPPREDPGQPESPSEPLDPAAAPAETSKDAPQEPPMSEPELPQNNTLYILMYHSIVPDGTPCNAWMRTDTQFREDLQWLADNGYSTVLPSELAAGKPLPERAVMLTFDDGYDNNYTTAYPILQEFQAKAVISLIVSCQDRQDPGYLSWDMCAEMLDSGLVEIGSHTYNCHQDSQQGIGRLPGESRTDYEARVLTDLQSSIDLIEANLDTTVQFFAHPNGITEKWANDYLKEHFAVTVTSRYGSSDISKGLFNMNRCNISQEEPPSFTLPEK